MLFRTIVNTPKSDLQIDHSSPIMLLGSCFAQHIAKRLEWYQFDTYSPFGTLYNPLSIAKSIINIINQKTYSDDELIYQQEEWKCYDFHSTYNSYDKNIVIKTINDEISFGNNFIKKCNTFIITFGTSYVYYLKNNKEIVANCHKTNATAFYREALTIDSIIETYTDLINRIYTINPNINFVFTVSPIRHWKDGAHANQLSKSTLLLAIDALQKKFDKVFYFPAYELLLDDLRDYRFYEKDMLHPNEIAIDYIWNAFENTYLTNTSIAINKEIAAIKKSEQHRPINPQSNRYQLFLEEIEEKKRKLRSKYPYLTI